MSINKMTQEVPGVILGGLYLSNSAAFLLYNTLMTKKYKATGTLPDYQKDYIVSLLALGNTKPEIIKKFEARYGRAVHPSTIIRIKKRNQISIGEAHDKLAVRSEIIGADLLKQKAYKLMNNKLDRATADESAIENLRNKLKAGEITRSQFDIECARYEVLTLSELTKLSDAMHTQTKGTDPQQNMTPEDHAALAMLMSGMNSGNPLQLVQVLNPQMNFHPTAGNPGPQADTPATSSPDPVDV